MHLPFFGTLRANKLVPSSAEGGRTDETLCGWRFARIVGTTRWTKNVALRSSMQFGDRTVEMTIFDGAAPQGAVSHELAAGIAGAAVLLVSISPDPDSGRDPVLTHLRDAIRIAGIYGPGANAPESVKAGRAQRIVKPGQGSTAFTWPI
jgi:hypothetical protein